MDVTSHSITLIVRSPCSGRQFKKKKKKKKKGGGKKKKMSRREPQPVKAVPSATLATLVVALAFLSASDINIQQAQETALDRYVSGSDAVYGGKSFTRSRRGLPGYVLELTSQTWRTAADVDRPVWKHWLTIVKPRRTASARRSCSSAAAATTTCPTTADSAD